MIISFSALAETSVKGTFIRETPASVTVKKPLKQTCGMHGGINCTAGSDKDGSVVCYDGFKDSLQRFNFECSAPKLLLEKSDLVNGILVAIVRNNSSVDAKDIHVFAYQDAQEIALHGPEEIAGFESGQYELPWKWPGLGPPSVLIKCSNCP